MNALILNLLIILFGILSTLGMSFFLTMIRELKFSDVSLVKITGSFFYRKDNKKTNQAGWAIHLALGIIFAFIYIYFFRAFPEMKQYLTSYFFLGTSFGVIHGLGFATLFYFWIAKNHPNEAFHTVGFKGALYYLVAHVLYGMGFGFLCSVLNFFQNHSLSQILINF